MITASIPQYRFTAELELSDFDFGYIPTSVYLDGVQTYEYVVQNGVVFFNNMIPQGTILTALPADAVRVLNAEIVTITVEEIGLHSLFTDPFGRMEFSLDGVTWVKSLTHVFPATVYCRLTPHGYISDFKCRADFELVIWRGTDEMFVNEIAFD